MFQTLEIHAKSLSTTSRPRLTSNTVILGIYRKRRLSYKILENEYTVCIMYPQAIGDGMSCCEPWQFYQIGDPILEPQKHHRDCGWHAQGRIDMNMDVVIHWRRPPNWSRELFMMLTGGTEAVIVETEFHYAHSLQALSLLSGWGICLLNSLEAIPSNASKKERSKIDERICC